MKQAPDLELLHELEPIAERLYERHLATAKEWFPHEYVPWSRGEDFRPGEEWAEGEFTPPPAVRSALFVNLLTEDNLPYYFRSIEEFTDSFQADNVWGQWVRRWTAEEGRHSIVIRDYLTVSRSVDPVVLERARMAQVEKGETPDPETTADGLVYVALQELATRIAHHNTGRLMGDPAGREVMKRVGSDENFHFIFYRDLVGATIEIDPSKAVVAIDRQVRDFEMPGTGIVGFKGHAKAIADVGIYDLQIHHDKILVPVVLGKWELEKLEGLSPAAEQARDRVISHIGKVGRVGDRLAEKREAITAG